MFQKLHLPLCGSSSQQFQCVVLLYSCPEKRKLVMLIERF